MSDLSPVETPEQWAWYHTIRERVLWKARSKGSRYDPNHPDDRRPGNYPLIYMVDGKPIGVLRVDLVGATAWFRRVAITGEFQRRGHGTRMMEAAMAFARGQGATIARSSVARDAVGFYEKLDFKKVDDVHTHPDEGVLMTRSL